VKEKEVIGGWPGRIRVKGGMGYIEVVEGEVVIVVVSEEIIW
jgi:hypothetical protein